MLKTVHCGWPARKGDIKMQARITRREALKLTAAGTLLTAAKVSGMQAGSAAPAPIERNLGAYKDGQYILPPLPYAFDALEPLYDKRTLTIHYTKHHAGYVRGLNKTLEKLAAARQVEDFSSIKTLSRALAFHGSGHVLHTLFWNSMIAGGSEVPESLASAIKRDFGSIEAAKKQFVAATKAVEASGWGVLAYEPIASKLLILQAEKHQNLTVWGVVPLLVCDVWEHAYYLQFVNNRGKWVDNFMKLANWKFAAKRLKHAQN